MITRIEALRFRCLYYTSQELAPFQVLVGPNGSGKSTFLDVVTFLGHLVEDGIDAAVESRTTNFQDLLWRRTGESFELAIEAHIPAGLRSQLGDPTFDTIRYEIAIGRDEAANEVVLEAETVRLKHADDEPPDAEQNLLFPSSRNVPETILSKRGQQGTRTVVNKAPGGNDNFYSETYSESSKGWVPAFKLGPRKSALANLPEDESRFPVATWLKNLLGRGVQQIMLDSRLLRQASRPGRGQAFLPDGSNLPWVVRSLEKTDPDRVEDWTEHLRAALPDLRGIHTVERPEDRHRYLVLTYRDDLQVPSWMVSDGTLRLLALTLPAYLQDLDDIFLIEEPENGIHPRAVETLYQSLESVYDAQILLATHSPVILSQVEPNDLLCFAKDDSGATDIVTGDKHPALREWQGEVNLSALYAAGVLG